MHHTGRVDKTIASIMLELELELIQSHMAQKPVLRGEVGCACVAREVSVERGGMGEHGKGTLTAQIFIGLAGKWGAVP